MQNKKIELFKEQHKKWNIQLILILYYKTINNVTNIREYNALQIL